MFEFLKNFFGLPFSKRVDCIIAGLGNPGKEYQGTRHNIGFDVLECLAKEFPGEWKTCCDSWSKEIFTPGKSKVLLTKPVTYMNRSGLSIQRTTNRIESQRILVVSDDMELPLGRVRFRKGGSSGGHNGLKSVIQNIGEEFHRLRIGIGKPGKRPVVEHVLSLFNEKEIGLKQRVIQVASEAVLNYADQGLEICMNKYNGINITI